MLPFNELLIKLLPGALAILLIGGAGYYFGINVKQTEVDELQAKLADYRNLGDRMRDIKTAIDADIKDKNQTLVDAYKSEMEKVRSDFGKARESLSAVTDELKKGGKSVNTSSQTLAEAIKNLPQGKERDEKIAEFIALMSDPNRLQQLCAATPVADAQMQKLKISFKIGAP